jgi:hypothetical protein
MTNQQKRNLGDIFKMILADNEGKFDEEIPAKELFMENNGQIVYPTDAGHYTQFSLTDWAQTQMAQKLEIPVRYFKKCPPELQAQQFNYWTQNSYSNWLFRARAAGNENLVRAVLSADRYSKLDNEHIVEMLRGILGEGDKADYDVSMWHLDDGGFHLRLTFPDLTTNIGTLADGSPDIHRVGLHIANSEVGKRSVMITPLVYRLVCTNGLMRWTNDGDSLQLRHVHLQHHEIYGRVAQAIGMALKAGDAMIKQLIQAKETPVENPLDIIRALAGDRQYSQAMTDTLTMSYAMNQAQTGANLFSVVQAITETAQKASHPDYRIEMEKDAADLLAKMVA